ncbi:MAG: hypothetical protein ACHQ49_12780 [Elusimicrobiota bacterium]
MRLTNFRLRLLVSGVICAGLVSLFPGELLSLGFGMASSVKKAVQTLDGDVQARQVSVAAAAAFRATLVVSNAGTGTGTITSSDNKITCTVAGPACAETFTTTTTVTLTATPTVGVNAQANSFFTGWSSPTGACAAQGETCTLTLNSSGVTQITASYSGGFLASLLPFDNGSDTVMNFRTGNTNCGSATLSTSVCDLYFSSGAFVSNAAVKSGVGVGPGGWITDMGVVSGVPAIQAYPSTGHVALSPAVAGHGYVMLLGDNTYAALYAQSVPPPGPGTVITVSPTTTTLTTPAPSPVSFSWVYPFQPASLSQSWLLTVTPFGTSAAAGTITSVPSGINCVGGGAGSGCSHVFATGTVVTLTATASAGSFLGWSGGATCNGTTPTSTCVFTGIQDVNETASFGYMGLAILATGNGAGTVTSSDNKIACGATCVETFASTATTTVSLTAVAGANSTFTGWTSVTGSAAGFPCAGQGPTCVLNVTPTGFGSVAGLTQVQPRFALNEVVVISTDNGTGLITSVPAGISCGNLNGTPSGNCVANFAANTLVTLTETPSAASVFNGWTVPAGFTCDSTCVTQSTYAFVVSGGSVTVGAAFHLPTLAVVVAGPPSGVLDSGQITSLPAGILCAPGDQSGGCGPLAFSPSPATISLTATPTNPGSLVTWSAAPGNCISLNNTSPGEPSTCSFSLVAPSTSATASFKRGGLIVNIVNPSSGSVTATAVPSGAPLALTCSADGTVCFTALGNASSTNFQLNATPNGTAAVGQPTFGGFTPTSGTTWGLENETLPAAAPTTSTATATTSDAALQVITATFQ